MKIPMPPKMPVKNRLTLVDSFNFTAWMNQSKPMVSRNIMPIVLLKKTLNTANNKTNNCPINTPVHLAHTGNCFPL